MNEKVKVYLYEPRGYSPGYVYRDFNDALKHMLKDERVESLEQLAADLDSNQWWYEFDVENRHISVDDGAEITEVELR